MSELPRGAAQSDSRASGQLEGAASDAVYLLLVPIVGALSGLVGVGIGSAIDALQALSFGGPRGGSLLAVAREAPAWLRVAAPASGGIAVAVLLLAGRRLAPGIHGTAGIIHAIAHEGGRVRVLPAIFRELLPSIACVGTGGSLGREGPLIRTGALIGSVLASRAGIAERRVKILVACGAAAGMAAAYNAPIGAALFAGEAILASASLDVAAPLAVASSLAAVVARALRGPQTVYQLAALAPGAPLELPLFALLGVALGLVSIAFTRGVRGGAKVFARLPLPVLHPVLGMALVGAIAILRPEVYGNGFDVVNETLHGRISPAWLLVALPFVKLGATSITLGSGCIGGLFTPALLVGALLGAAVGEVASVTASPAAFAIAGMAALTAGTSHAPASSVLLVLELTGRFEVTVPVLIASALSALVARRFYSPSIYTEALLKRGIPVPKERL